MRVVGVTEVTVAGVSLNFTIFFVEVGLKLAPVIVIIVPTTPLSGVKLSIDGMGASMLSLHEITNNRQAERRIVAKPEALNKSVCTLNDFIIL